MRALRFLLGLILLLVFPVPLALERLTLPPVLAQAGPEHSAPVLPVAPPVPPQTSNPVEIKATSPCILSADFTAVSPEQKSIFLAATKELPCPLLHSLETVIVKNTENMPRALAGKTLLELRSDVFTKPEFAALVIHELGHVVDLGGLQGTPNATESTFQDGSAPIFSDDPSVRFYQISWQNTTERKTGSKSADFVSGYALTDPFEDFAESFLFYRLHGKTFAQLAQENSALAQKYKFLRDVVFAGKEFLGQDESLTMEPRPWDATKL